MKLLANSTRICYTYDELSRVVGKKTETDDGSCEFSHHTFMYDAAGNLLNDTEVDTSFVYDTNNRLTKYNGKAVAYDLDGNMLSDGVTEFVYDSTNKLISAGNCTYTYNGDNVRIKNLCGETETTYVYDTNARLSRLLVKNTDGVITKYVYGRGLIGEENINGFKVYHYDYRGSTVALTDINGTITDTFEYDTYGKLISRTGNSSVIFLYNGRDGVVTDANGLLYMRARYYSPKLRRFINADILAGRISNAVTLNRYAYANGNPVSNVDPFGLVTEKEMIDKTKEKIQEILGDVSSVIQFYDAYISVLKSIASVGEQYSVQAEYDVDLISVGGTTVYWKTEVSVGAGDISFDINKLIEQLEAEDVLDFLKNSDAFKLELGDRKFTFEIDEHTAMVLALSGKFDMQTLATTYSASYSVVHTDDANNSITNTIGIKQKITPLKPPSKKEQSLKFELSPTAVAISLAFFTFVGVGGQRMVEICRQY